MGEQERAAEATPQIGDHVTLLGTNIAGDVRRVDRSLGHDCVIFKVTTVHGASRKSKAARAFRGAWITCRPELLLSHERQRRNSVVSEPERGAPSSRPVLTPTA
jgi:hypothetical protein